MTLLNKYQRQQRLNPNEQIDPMMRSMMDAVRQVYQQNGEEQVSTEEGPTDENNNQSPTTETTTVQ